MFPFILCTQSPHPVHQEDSDYPDKIPRVHGHKVTMLEMKVFFPYPCSVSTVCSWFCLHAVGFCCGCFNMDMRLHQPNSLKLAGSECEDPSYNPMALAQAQIEIMRMKEKLTNDAEIMKDRIDHVCMHAPPPELSLSSHLLALFHFCHVAETAC